MHLECRRSGVDIELVAAQLKLCRNGADLNSVGGQTVRRQLRPPLWRLDAASDDALELGRSFQRGIGEIERGCDRAQISGHRLELGLDPSLPRVTARGGHAQITEARIERLC